jgi:hypothetical protein
LEELIPAIRRRRLRARRTWAGGHGYANLAASLGLDYDALVASLRSPWFGTAWAEIESGSPVLKRRPITMIELPEAVAAAETLLARPAALADPTPFTRLMCRRTRCGAAILGV